MGININRIVLGLTSLIMLSGSLYLTENWRFLHLYLLFIPLFLIIFIGFLRAYIRINVTILLISSFFIVFSLIAAAVNSSTYLFISTLGLTILFIGLLIYYPSLVPKNGNKIIFQSILISHFPIIVLPILFSGLNSKPYQGIFYNPNSFGTVIVSILAVLLAVLVGIANSERIKIKKIHFNILILSIIFASIGTVLSGSRTSFVTMIFLFSIAFVLIFAPNNFNINYKKILTITFFSLIFILIIKTMIPIREITQELIIEKFIRKASSGDVLDSRGVVWTETIKQAKMFGHGRDFFKSLGLGAHSTYFSLLGQYGWLATLSFVVFLIVGLRRTIIYTMLSKDIYRYIPLFITLTFILLSITEGMMLKISMLSTIAAFGVVFSFRK